MSDQLVGALPVGTLLHEYRIQQVLGHGGFGITYLAFDTHLDKPVAIKEYLPSDLAARINVTDITVRSPETREAFQWGRHHFLKEARVLARFQHPNLIQVHRFFELNNTAYFVMDYAQGTTLAALIKKSATLPELRLRDILLPVCDGLDAVHKEGILHRDIKPDNIMMRADGTVVLIDFGAARQSMTQLTRSILSVLTAGYAPLEQYATEGNQGPWTDVYALAAVAYRAVTGARPSDAVNRVRHDPVIPAAKVAAGKYAPHFLDAIDWGLRVNPEDRPQDIITWKRALDGMVRVPPPSVQPDSGRIVVTSPGAPAPDAPTVALKPAEHAPPAREPELPAPIDLGAPAPNAASAPPQPEPQRTPLSRYAAIAVATAALAGGAWWWSGRGTAPPEPPAVASPEPAPTVADAPAPVTVPEPAASTVVTETGPATTTATPPAPPAPSTMTAPVVDPVPVPPAAKAKPKPSTKPPEPKPRAPKMVAVAQMAPRSTFQDCPECPPMVALPVGSFRMGAATGPGVPPWESPPHTVSIARPFALGRDEVTVAQWGACVAAKACPAVPPGRGSLPNAPAVNLSWDAASKYAAWLAKRTGRKYRLPSEAEWEYATRGGTTTSRWWGDSRKGQCQHANAADKSALKVDGSLDAVDCDDGHAGLAAAGTLKPNPFGLYHTAGNVWEWTQDCWRDTYAGAPADGSAAGGAGCALRVIRGGSWRTKAESLRSSARGRSTPVHSGEDLGLRVAAE